MNKEKKIFRETDGVRGKANYYPLDAETVLKFGKALAEYVKRKTEKNPNRPYKVIIGKDTRRSGYMLEQSLTAGFLSRGVDVMTIGPAPTPAISHLVQSFALDMGVMITASHNPYYDNGIKVFHSNGRKFTDEEELEIEDIFFNFEFNGSEDIGRAKRIEDVSGRYIEFIKSIPDNISLKGFKIVVDCANGATYNVAPTVFKELGAKVIEIAVEPDGYNINENCGALHPENMKDIVLKEKADLGVALDGDGDRVIMVDEKGNIIDGDYIMALVAKNLKERGELSKDSIVITEYSNQALVKHLEESGIHVVKVPNGDRAVAWKCEELGLNFGGEQTGHFLFTDYTEVGDGTLAALLVMRILIDKKKSLSELAYVFDKYPQRVFNVEIDKKRSLGELKEFNEKIKEWEVKFKGEGRVYCRYSGTENLLRIMIESKEEEYIEPAGKELSEIAKKLLS
jgi:phosphoglucosamine mutase